MNFNIRKRRLLSHYLPVTSFTDTKRFTAGAFVFFDGAAP